MKLQLSLYVPLPGQTLKLLQEWEFNLLAEGENERIGEKLTDYKLFNFGYNCDKDLQGTLWTPKDLVKNLESAISGKKYREANELIGKFLEENKSHVKKALKITIPAGAEIKIRKAALKGGKYTYLSRFHFSISAPNEFSFRNSFFSVAVEDINNIICEIDLDQDLKKNKK